MNQPRYRWLSIATPLFLVALWEAAVQFGWLNRIFYPPPSEVITTFGRMVADGSLAEDVGRSLLRVGAGVLLGGIPAIIIGLLMGISPLVRAAVRPLAAAIYPIPKIALLPLVIVLLGIGEASKIITIALSVFFLMVLNVAASVMQIDPRHFEVARSFGARQRDLFWTVALPASMPGIMNSIKLGVGFALTLIVGIEFVGSGDGVGYLIWNSYEIYAIDRMIGALTAVALIGWLITTLLDAIEALAIPWQTQSSPHLHAVARRTRVWLRATRPWSFSAAVIPVLLGAAIAAGVTPLNWWHLILTLFGVTALQAGANLLNDYFDHQRGTDTHQLLGIGGAIQRGELTPRQILIGGGVAITLGGLSGLWLALNAGPLVIWFGIVGVLIACLYTGGPFALAYHALGELAVFLAMGPLIVLGTYYVQTGSVAWNVVVNALPVGFLVAAILHANNLRDRESDARANKRTLATRLGPHGARVEYYVLLGATYISLLVAVAMGSAPVWGLIALVTLPLAIRLVRSAATASSVATFQPVLRQTAALHARFGVLFAAGWILAGLF